MYNTPLDMELDSIVPDGKARPKFFWSDPETHHKSRDWIRIWAYTHGSPRNWRPNTPMNGFGSYERGIYDSFDLAPPYAPVANPYGLTGMMDVPARNILIGLGAAAIGGWLLSQKRTVLGLAALAGSWYVVTTGLPSGV